MTSRGYPPSIREIGDAVGLTSTSSVAHQLRTLERKGYLRRDPNRPRAVDVRGAEDVADAAPHHRCRRLRRAAGADVRAGARPHRRRRTDPGRGGRRGRLPAAPRTRRRRLAVPAQGRGRLDGRRRICDGDWVVVRQQNVADNGDIVAAMIDGEATVKTFKRTGGQVWLMPHNPAFDPIPGNDAAVLGKVVTVIRKI